MQGRVIDLSAAGSGQRLDDLDLPGHHVARQRFCTARQDLVEIDFSLFPGHNEGLD